MIPFYIFYSMFGFQRVGDRMWAFGDMRGRGFLLGATAGRTTLNGEGLQHQDGHSLLLASTVPNLAAYDPAFAYEVATIVRDGMARMYGDDARGRLLLPHPLQRELPDAGDAAGPTEATRRTGSSAGLYRFAAGARGAVAGRRRSCSAAPPRARPGRPSSCWPTTTTWPPSCGASRRTRRCGRTPWPSARWNRLHPTELPRTPYVTEALSGTEGPFVAVTDFMKAVPDQVARWVPGHLSTLGTDGYGRSDSRAALRRHFETDAAHVVVAVLAALADIDDAKPEEVADAIAHYGLDADAVEPRLA